MSDPTRVLLVDDNAMFLQLIEPIVARVLPDAEIQRAHTGEEALDYLLAEPWDLVLLDYRLPDLDGVEVLAEIRKRALDCAVVISTGEGDEQLAADLFRMGAADYLPKSGITEASLRRSFEAALMQLTLKRQIDDKSDALVKTSRQLAERTTALDTAYSKLQDKKVQLQGLSESLEQIVLQRTEELRQTTTFLNQVLDSTTSHFIVATDAAGQILTFNSGAEEAFGYGSPEVVGRHHFRMLFEELYDDDAALSELMEQLHTAGSLQTELIGLDHEARTFLAKVTIDRMAGGAEGYVVIGTDVTRERELEVQNIAYIDQIETANQDLRRKNEQILEANRLKSEFLANVSHELRTPLNAIIGYSDLMVGGIYGDMNPKQFKAVSGMSTRARDLLELINGILDLAKIEAGKFELRVDEFQVGEVIEVALETGRVLAKDMTVEIVWDDEDMAQAPMRTDAQRVRQILLNLVNNAVKFTRDGTVRIETRPYGEGQLEIRVVDTGIGIPEDQLPHIFDEFRQVDGTSTREFEGTGLGLAISQKFARGLGGDLTVTSTVGEGSAFMLRIPRTLPGSGGRTTDDASVPFAIATHPGRFLP